MDERKKTSKFQMKTDKRSGSPLKEWKMNFSYERWEEKTKGNYWEAKSFQWQKRNQRWQLFFSGITPIHDFVTKVEKSVKIKCEGQGLFLVNLRNSWHVLGILVHFKNSWCISENLSTVQRFWVLEILKYFKNFGSLFENGVCQHKFIF